MNEFFDKIEAFLLKIFSMIENVFKLFQAPEEETEEETQA